MRARASMTLLLIAGLISGCAPDGGVPTSFPDVTTRSELWATEAVAWNDAMADAVDFPNLIFQFFAENVILDDRPGGGLRQVVHGRNDYLEFSIQQRGYDVPFVIVDHLVSADEELQYKTVDAWSGVVDVLSRMTFGAEGVESIVETYSIRKPTWVRYDDFEELARLYIDFWNGESDVTAATLYENDAEIADTLLGDRISGIGEITASLGAGHWPDLPHIRMQRLPTDRGPAVFVGPSDDPSIADEVNLLIDANDISGCPGKMGISLAFHGAKIVQERRFHDVQSMRRCFDPTHLLAGWWEGIEIPGPIRRERTGTIRMPQTEKPIVVYNGNEHTDDFIRWGMERFGDADLALPRVTSITFLFDPEFCSDRSGLAAHEEDGTIITLCLEGRHVCDGDDCHHWTRYARHLLLHELAHAWMADHLDEAMRSDFMALEGVPRWYEPGDPWAERGIERAANTLMFGLMDEIGAQGPAGPGSCKRWGPGFRLLTGVDPIAPDCRP